MHKFIDLKYYNNKMFLANKKNYFNNKFVKLNKIIFTIYMQTNK